MNGGSKIVDLRVSDVDFGAPLAAAPVAYAAGEPLEDAEPVVELDDYHAPTSVWAKVLSVVAVMLALGWIGFIGWYAGPALLANPQPMALAQFAAALAAPPAWIGVLWLIARRSSKAEAQRFNATARSMRTEADHLQNVIAAMTRTIEANRLALGDQIAHAETQAAGLDAAAHTAVDKLNVLLATLPKALAETEALAARIEQTGLTASERAAALDAQIVALGARGKEADALTSGAADRLAANHPRI